MLALGSWPAGTEVVRVRVGCQQSLSLGITASFSKHWHAISSVACSPDTHGLSHGTKRLWTEVTCTISRQNQVNMQPFHPLFPYNCNPRATCSTPDSYGMQPDGSLCCHWERSWSGKLQYPQPTLWKREINLYVFSHWDLQICLLLQRSLTCLIG